MRAIRVHAFGPPQVLALEDLREPTPGPGEVLVRVGAAGVNPVDTYVRAGTYSELPSLPYTPGIDAGGVVEALGTSYAGELEIGSRVYTAGSVSGTYAQLAACKGAQVHALPDGLSAAQGAALGTPYATAYRALFQRARAVAGETVLVHGASGGVGLAAVQFALAAGLTVIGTAGSRKGRELIAAQGVEHALDHGDPAHLAAAVEASSGRGVDVIVELLANANLGTDPRALAKGGRVVVVGSRGRVEVDPRDLMDREADVRGMRMPNATPADLAEAHAAIAAGLKDGSLRPAVGRELPLAEASRAHREIIEGKASGKTVLVP
jgi:NADPH2:quinone reductase